jgi:Zyg-11 protein homolog
MLFFFSCRIKGNVAEVKSLRGRLCKSDYIDTFRSLLFQSSDGIEIPYNSAGVLVHIMSDGAQAWRETYGTQAKDDTHSDKERDAVIGDIESAIDKWDMRAERNINYRSFEPIFRLVNEYANPICQRWSCWALANLTTVYPDIYCPLFDKENGRLLLDKLMQTSGVDEIIKKYSVVVLQNVANYKQVPVNVSDSS